MKRGRIMNKSDCASYFDAGNSYLEAAKRGNHRRSVFSGTMIYHILCLSVEKFLMGIFCYHNAIPQHSTLSHMVQEVAAFTDVPKALIERVQSMDNILNLCEPNAPLQMTLTENQLQDMLSLAEKIRDIVSTYIPQAA
jgi:c-di-GMP-related signal transduction protein